MPPMRSVRPRNPAAQLSRGQIDQSALAVPGSDPTISASESLVSGILIWVKAVGLICLVCWVVAWLIIGVKERVVGTGPLV